MKTFNSKLINLLNMSNIQYKKASVEQIKKVFSDCSFDATDIQQLDGNRFKAKCEVYFEVVRCNRFLKEYDMEVTSIFPESYSKLSVFIGEKI